MTGWRLLCGGLVFVAVTTTAATGLAVLAGKMETPSAWMALTLGAVAAFLTMRSAAAPRQRITAADTILLTIFGLASLRAFLWVLYPAGPDLKVLSPHNLGDMALHLNLINRWASGGTFWPDNPFLAGAIFPYHAGMDVWNALLRLLGVPLLEGLRWTGLLGAAAAAAALWRWGRGFALAAFLFAGGLGALAILHTGTLDGMESDRAWKNLFLAMFVTQRGLLYSLPAALVLMTVWRAQLAGQTDGPRLPILAQVALYATMPLFNAPAFLFLSALLAACAITAWPQGRLRPFLVVGLLSIIPATWLVHLVTAGFTAPQALRFAPGWMQGDDGWWFWADNFGLFLPLAAALLVLVWTRRGDAVARVFVTTGAATLVFSFLFLIAPWPWDNTKLILWGYLVVLPFLWSDLLARWPLPLRAAACVLLFTSGALALVGGLDGRHGYQLAARGELADVQVMLRSLPVNARLATAPSYEHPALLLGRPVVMGHDGHLYSQGLDYTETAAHLDILMSGADRWRHAARTLRTYYLFWGPREKARWPDSTQPWRDSAYRIATSGENEIFLLTPSLMDE